MTTARPSPTAFFSDPAIVQAYDAGRFAYPDTAINHIASQIPNNSVLLDMGAGNGRTLRTLFAAHRMNDVEIHAVDPSTDMLDSLQHSLAHWSNVTAHQGRFSNIPLTSCSVDTIICGASIHWGTTTTDEARQTKSELSRVLKPNGKLIVLSDDWEGTDPLGQDLLTAQERMITAFNGARTQDNDTDPINAAQHQLNRALLTLRLTAFTMKKMAGHFSQKDTNAVFRLKQQRVGDVFIEQNRLSDFFSKGRKTNMFRDEYRFDAQTLRDELHSQTWFDQMPPDQQQYADTILSNIIERQSKETQIMTANRACLVVSGHLKR